MGLVIRKYSYINDRVASVDGRAIPVPAGEEKFLTALYRARRVDYPRFFKMDALSKLGFLASELIFEGDASRFTPRDHVAILCFNRSSSLESDAAYQATIRHGEEYFPSPSLFVYTLPNIVTAEIAIRNRLHGETAFYVLERFDPRALVGRVGEAFQDAATRAVLVAWVESFRDSREVFMMLVEKNDTIFDLPFSVESIVELLNRGRNG
ncbi:MAG: hypothetical protein LBK12_03980 [Odoribacteraceae bacterium]|jgi:hypothetical protein|nr:hypothetical protein [Odoribacteraceae bacterium]